jgi:hypothetical protein
MAARGKRGQCQGHLGLWAEFALLNHSCTANAVSYTVEDRMVVRASRHIQQARAPSLLP